MAFVCFVFNDTSHTGVGLIRIGCVSCTSKNFMIDDCPCAASFEEVSYKIGFLKKFLLFVWSAMKKLLKFNAEQVRLPGAFQTFISV